MRYASRPSQEEITEQTMREFARYKRENANEYFIRISEEASESRVLVTVEVKLNVARNALERALTRGEDAHLLDASIIWPYHGSDAKITRENYHHEKPLVVHQLKTLSFPQSAVSATVPDKEPEGYTRFCVQASAIARILSRPSTSDRVTLRFEFECLAAYFSLGERPPFGRHRFNMTLRPSAACASLSLVFLDYPDAITLRSRNDNARYHSLTMGIDDHYHRKTTYFEGFEIFMFYTFGSADSSELAAPILPIVRAGIGTLVSAIGLIILALNKALPSLSTAFFILALAPWFFDAMQKRRLFSVSASKKVSWTELSTIVFLSIHTLSLIVVGLVILTNDEDVWRIAGYGFFALAFVLLACAIVLIIGLSRGSFLRFACDRCGKRHSVRKIDVVFERLLNILDRLGWERLLRKYGVWTHERSRRVVCTRCRDELANEDAVIYFLDFLVTRKVYAKARDHLSPLYVHHHPVDTDKDLRRDELFRLIQRYVESHPDCDLTITHIETHEDRVRCQIVLSGLPPLRGLKRLSPLSLEGIAKFRIADERIIESWLDLRRVGGRRSVQEPQPGIADAGVADILAR